ncbi:gamma-glutamyl-gamma-aminobutyrate hydrolase [Escherichia coli O102:H6]|nr:gamma-glutamyl-gamma-aminobutyrate hydrolase [Escherichia coli]
MENIMSNPVIGVVMCRNRLKGHATQTLQEKYLNAIIHAGGLPIALPHALAEPSLLEQLLPKLDGIYLPGSPSNVQPHLYGENGDEPDADPGRDLLSMALINAALERRIPIFAICRGLQELVVATGGSLHRKLCEQPELLEHREDPELPVEQQYAPSHEVLVEEGGLLSALLPECSNFWVNSLHGQGAKVVSPRLRVEARSPDGLVEAVSVINHPFALGVQWHPEWNSSEYALSRILFEGFITACQHHIAEKQRL